MLGEFKKGLVLSFCTCAKVAATTYLSLTHLQGMKLQIGYSPCPNDTFIFDAMVHGKVDTEGLSFEPQLADVEELNVRAFAKTNSVQASYPITCLLYTSDAADDLTRLDLACSRFFYK